MPRAKMSPRLGMIFTPVVELFWMVFPPRLPRLPPPRSTPADVIRMPIWFPVIVFPWIRAFAPGWIPVSGAGGPGAA